MPSSSAATRSLVLAVFGMGAASAFAQGPNVTAFNPYSGVGLPGGPAVSYGPQAAYPIVDTVGPAAGPAFNPWQTTAPMPMAGPGAAAFNPGQPFDAGPAPAAPAYVYNPGAGLPPPGRIESRIVAIPERGNARIPRDLLYSSPPAPPPAVATAEPRPIAPVAAPPKPIIPVVPPAPTPTPATRPTPSVAAVTPPPAAAPAPPPSAAPAPPAAEPGRPVAVTTATPSLAPATKGSAVASIPFTAQSADLSDVAKSELDRVAKNISDKALRQVELRAFATGADPESRKIALARALVVRSYLIDRGVKSRIEVGGFSGGDGERVDILVPNT